MHESLPWITWQEDQLKQVPTLRVFFNRHTYPQHPQHTFINTLPNDPKAHKIIKVLEPTKVHTTHYDIRTKVRREVYVWVLPLGKLSFPLFFKLSSIDQILSVKFCVIGSASVVIFCVIAWPSQCLVDCRVQNSWNLKMDRRCSSISFKHVVVWCLFVDLITLNHAPLDLRCPDEKSSQTSNMAHVLHMN